VESGTKANDRPGDNMTLSALTEKGFQVEFHSHAEAILTVDFPSALSELEAVLSALTIPIEQLVRGGGGETETTQGLRRALAAHAWIKHNFEIKKLIDDVPRESISHEVDHVRSLPKGKIALEIEWNNKDPFFDRDLENFKRLHAEGAISVGVLITRGRTLQENIRAAITRFAVANNLAAHDDLQRFDLEPTRRQRKAVDQRMKSSGKPFAEAWAAAFCADKYGSATTHWTKLEDRVRRGIGNPCPLLLIGVPYTVLTHSALASGSPQ
jgi:hypothetical protein